MCAANAIHRRHKFVSSNSVQHGDRTQLLALPKWLSPPTGYIKMNIGGSWNRDRRVAGFGIIVRGNTDNFVAAKCGCLEDAFSPLQIVKASKDSSTNLSLVGQIVEDIKVFFH
ncbi:hypothetical protein C1H46_006321 [Malus baccata]|uniref:RNase H type-1 domain-containing protein n=1 Tax=Malus baccata TaxID=106549 RepID=A0A540NAG5_MALBA|nr:hypothetical protein C1H46_006321 [Malus baccata]